MSKKPIVLTNNKVTEIKDADALLLTGGISANGLTITKEQLSYLLGARSNLQDQIYAKAGGAGGFTDSFSLKINATDSIATPTDNYSMVLNLTAADSNAGQTETVTLKFPQPDFADSSATPSESKSFLFRVWLSGSTGGATPTNANGENNATFATQTTAIGGAASITMTSALGSNIPNIGFTSAIYRAWFASANRLATSTGSIVLRSTTALFADKTIFTNSGLNTNIDKLDGSFTYDLIANGINTLARLQSLQVLHIVTDAAAGVTPHILNEDAGCVEILATL